jgi:hypothetical protein
MKTNRELLCFIILILLAHHASARDLVGSATTIKSYVQAVAGAVSGIGILLGSILYSVGVAELGKRVAISGAIGTFMVGSWLGIESLIRNWG